MSSRRLIQFGKNSFVLSIPKSWVERNKLKKGDEVNVEESAESLILSSRNESASELRIKKISCDDSIGVGRNIIAAYMNNYSIIEIHGLKLRDHIKDIEETTHSLVALEIMEQNSKKIVIKDFLNTQDISIESIIKRMDIIIRAMFSEAHEFFDKNEKIDLDKMDVDINRLFYVGHKILNKLLDKPSLSKSLNIHVKETLFYGSMIDSLEKIADQQKRFIRCIEKIDNTCVTKEHLRKAFEALIERYLETIKAFYKLDKDEADRLYMTSKKSMEVCEEIIDKYIHKCKKTADIHYTSEAVEKLKKFENYMSQISKLVINKE